MKRIFFSPVCAVLFILEVFVKKFIDVYSFFANLVWKLMIITSIWAVCRQSWKQLIITGIIAAIFYIGLFLFTVLRIVLEETRRLLWA